MREVSIISSEAALASIITPAAMPSMAKLVDYRWDQILNACKQALEATEEKHDSLILSLC